MASPQYKTLQRAIMMLRRHLLPRKFNKEGIYKERVFTGVISFRILSHAAIEEYFERRVVEIAVNASRACKSNGYINHTAACLISFCNVNFGEPPESIKPSQESQRKLWPEKLDMISRAKKAASTFVIQVTKENHGILEKNLLKMLLPVGFRHDRIDPFLLSELDSFGRLRGEFAHSSPSVHITKKPNPEEELKRVQELVRLLAAMDAEFDTLARDWR